MVDEHSEDPDRSTENEGEGGSDTVREQSTESSENMLARTWTIAANFRKPGDYGIPTAPSFCGECRTDGSLVLFACSKSRKPLITVENSMNVRR